MDQCEHINVKHTNFICVYTDSWIDTSNSMEITKIKALDLSTSTSSKTYGCRAEVLQGESAAGPQCCRAKVMQGGSAAERQCCRKVKRYKILFISGTKLAHN